MTERQNHDIYPEQLFFLSDTNELFVNPWNKTINNAKQPLGAIRQLQDG